MVIESVKQAAEEIYELFVKNHGTEKIVSTSIRNILIKDYKSFIHNGKLYYFNSLNEGGCVYKIYSIPAHPARPSLSKHSYSKDSNPSNSYKRVEWSYVCEGDLNGELPDDYIDFKNNNNMINDSPDVLALDYNNEPLILRLRIDKSITSAGNEKYFWRSPYTSYSCRLGKIKCWQFIHYPKKRQ